MFVKLYNICNSPAALEGWKERKGVLRTSPRQVVMSHSRGNVGVRSWTISFFASLYY